MCEHLRATLADKQISKWQICECLALSYIFSQRPPPAPLPLCSLCCIIYESCSDFLLVVLFYFFNKQNHKRLSMGIPGATSQEWIKTNDIKPVIKAAKLQAKKNKMQLWNKLNKYFESTFILLSQVSWTWAFCITGVPSNSRRTKKWLLVQL